MPQFKLDSNLILWCIIDIEIKFVCFLIAYEYYRWYYSSVAGKRRSETNSSGLQVAWPFWTSSPTMTGPPTGRDCLPVAMVLITSWRRCIQAGKMKMAPDNIHTLLLLWKPAAQMLTWLTRWVIHFGTRSLQWSSQNGKREKGEQSHSLFCV